MARLPVSRFSILTRDGAIAVTDTGGPGRPLVMLHGAGASGAVFSSQFEGPLADHFRIIAIDLPGHGRSDRSTRPDMAYTLPNTAQMLAGLFPHLGIERAVVYGWSLGGHIVLEMMARFPALFAGAAISGAPPFAPGTLGTLRAFHLNPTSLLAGKQKLSYNEAARLARMFYGEDAGQHHIAMILATDPEARPRLMRSIVRGEGADPRKTVRTSPVPLAIFHGAHDPAIRLGYLEGLHYANLWEGRIHIVPHSGHAPFLGAPHSFDALLHRFASSAAIARSAMPEPFLTRHA